MSSLKLSLLGATGLMAIAVVMPSYAQAQETQEQEEDIIVVEGTRSSVINSIEAKRNADTISDVLSADQAERFPDNNIGEALARIPGVSFQRDNNTGDGEFISIRGLDSTYNTVLHNGLRTGTADTFRRSALDVITGDNISSIEIVKAPLPEHASEGIGGVVDIRTRGALERRERVSFDVSSSNNSFADQNGYRIGGSFTRHLSDNVGVNLSARFRKRYIESFQINPATTVPDVIADVTLNDINGNPVVFDGGDEDVFALVPTDFIPIENFNTEQVNYTHDDIERDQFTISGNIDWQVTPSTKITFGGRHDEIEDTQDTNVIEFDVDNSFSGGVNTWRDPELTFRGAIEDEEEIESRLFLRSETQLDKWDINFVAGWSRAYRDLPFQDIHFNQELEDTPSSPGTGASDERAITFAPFDLSVGGGLFPAPVPLNQTVFLEALNPFCGDSCGEVEDYNFELEDSRENIRHTARLDFVRDFEDHDYIRNVKFGVQWERSEFEDRDIDISFTDDTLGNGPTGAYSGTDTPGVSDLGDSNLEISEFPGLITSNIISFNPIGNPFADSGFVGIPQFDAALLRDFNSTYLSDFLASGDDPRQSAIIESTENFYSAYAQAKLTFDKLDIIGGVRIEHYDADFDGFVLLDSGISFDEDGTGPNDDRDSVDLVAPTTASNTGSTDNFEILPRIALSYNLSDNSKLRASYTTSISRPTFDLIAGTVEGDFNIDVLDGVDIASATINDVELVDIIFELGNPDLKNSYSQNFDVSYEHYFNDQNAFSIAVFYKKIDDFIFTSFATDNSVNFGTEPLDPGEVFASLNFPSSPGTALIEQLGGYEALAALPQADVIIDQAQNGEEAEIYGLELGLFHTFDYLPGILSNLGFIGNATFTESETTINLGELTAGDAYVQLGFANAGDDLVQEFPFFNSPEAIYNATLFFDYEGLEANLSYRNSGVQLEEIEAFGISQYQQGREFIDLDVEYTFRDVGAFDRVTIFFEGNDLTDDGQEPSVFETRGKSEAFNDNSTFNGRTFTVGTRFRF